MTVNIFPWAIQSDIQRQERLLSPDLPSEEWWVYAEKFPVVAIRSPLFPLLTLEEPARWHEMFEKKGPYWIDQHLSLLSKDKEAFFISHCIQQVPSLNEKSEKARLAAAEEEMRWIWSLILKLLPPFEFYPETEEP